MVPRKFDISQIYLTNIHKVAEQLYLNEQEMCHPFAHSRWGSHQWAFQLSFFYNTFGQNDWKLWLAQSFKVLSIWWVSFKHHSITHFIFGSKLSNREWQLNGNPLKHFIVVMAVVFQFSLIDTKVFHLVLLETYFLDRNWLSSSNDKTKMVPQLVSWRNDQNPG